MARPQHYLFLELNGYRFAASEEEATRAVLELASGNLDEAGYTAFLRATFFADEEVTDRSSATSVIVEPALLMLASIACNAYNICMQYTIRNVPDTLDEALRRAAREQGRSLNEVAIEALARGAGITGERNRQRDLNDIAGTWRKDPAFDSARDAQDTIDEKMWK